MCMGVICFPKLIQGGLLSNDMKRIRIEYYRYRIRKGRVDVLLQKIEGSDSFCIPCRYAGEEDRIDGLIKQGEIVDDGDLVIRLVVDHLNLCNLVWIPLKELTEYPLERNDSLEAYKTIFRLFLTSGKEISDIKGEISGETESSLLDKVEEWYDAILRKRAKLRYIEILKDALEGNGPIVLDACVIPPSKDAIERELETLEHFNPERRDDEYDLMIDWETLGWRIEPIRFSGFTKRGGLLDELED